MDWKKLGIIAAITTIAVVYTATANPTGWNQQPYGNGTQPYYPMWYGVPWGYAPTGQPGGNVTYPQPGYIPYNHYGWGCPMMNIMMGYGNPNNPNMPYYGGWVEWVAGRHAGRHNT